MSEPDRRPCVCGHKAYDHLGAGRCDNGSRRCGCCMFRECCHPETEPWRGRHLCVACNNVVDVPAAAELGGVA